MLGILNWKKMYAAFKKIYIYYMQLFKTCISPSLHQQKSYLITLNRIYITYRFLLLPKPIYYLQVVAWRNKEYVSLSQIKWMIRSSPPYICSWWVCVTRKKPIPFHRISNCFVWRKSRFVLPILNQSHFHSTKLRFIWDWLLCYILKFYFWANFINVSKIDILQNWNSRFEITLHLSIWRNYMRKPRQIFAYNLYNTL